MDDKLQETIDRRFTLDRQIQDLLGSAFEDYGLDGMKYVAAETARIVNSLQAEVTEGKLVL